MNRDTTYGRATVRQVCAVFGISHQAYYQSRCGPAPVRSSARAGLEAKVREFASSHPAWGVRKIHAYLRWQEVVASRKRVCAAMRRLRLVLPAPEHREEGATDLTTVWTK